MFCDIQFRCVGQGLFVTGCVTSDYDLTFRWVYDCGSETRDCTKREVDRYCRELGTDRIDLICISHFDHDHVSGAKRLLERCGARIIVLPYVSLVARMFLAEAWNAMGFHLRFLADPVRALREVAPHAFIMLIQGSEGSLDDPNNPALDIGEIGGTAKSMPNDYGADSEAVLEDVLVSPHTTTFHMASNYEFCFYNEAVSDGKMSGLHQSVAGVIIAHRTDDHRYRKGLIKALRRVFAMHFGTGRVDKALVGRNANRISLVMYASPTDRAHSCIIGLGSRSGILCTGDIFWKRRDDYQAAITHYGSRWENVGVMQIPHHGSSENWAAGNCSKSFHQVSVLPYGKPNRHDHPGEDVLRDIRNTRVCHVTQEAGATFFQVGH